MCTGNVCRSPFLEQLLRAELDRALPDGHGIALASAGTRPPVGAPLDARTARSLRAAGVEPTAHAARRLTTADVRGAGLVLTATREHRATAVRAHPPALRYAFTAAEFGRLCLLVDPGSLVDRAEGGDRLEALVRSAAARRGTVAPPLREADDIADPVGAGDDVHLAAIEALTAVVAVVVALLVDAAPRGFRSVVTAAQP